MNEMESVDCALKQMGETVSALEGPGLATWGQDKLTECQSRWESLSKQVRKRCLLNELTGLRKSSAPSVTARHVTHLLCC